MEWMGGWVDVVESVRCFGGKEEGRYIDEGQSVTTASRGKLRGGVEREAGRKRAGAGEGQQKRAECIQGWRESSVGSPGLVRERRRVAHFWRRGERLQPIVSKKCLQPRCENGERAEPMRACGADEANRAKANECGSGERRPSPSRRRACS
eukprot:6199248-Pleurochrysis_carterae.AAC.1